MLRPQKCLALTPTRSTRTSLLKRVMKIFMRPMPEEDEEEEGIGRRGRRKRSLKEQRHQQRTPLPTPPLSLPLLLTPWVRVPRLRKLPQQQPRNPPKVCFFVLFVFYAATPESECPTCVCACLYVYVCVCVCVSVCVCEGGRGA